MTRISMSALRGWIAAGFLCISVLVLQACLAGSEDTRGTTLEKADAQLAAGRCTEALASYEAIVAADSTKSMAYLGQAKAVSCLYGINVDSLYASFFDSNTITILAVLGNEDSVLNRYLQGATKSLEPLRRLMDRDTLTRFWKYLDATTTDEEAEDPYFNARKAGMETYLTNAALGMAGYRPSSKFPLTDDVANRDELFRYFVVAEITRMSAKFFDFDGNGVIDFSTSDSVLRRLDFGNNPEIHIDSLSTLLLDLESDSTKVANLNDLIANMSAGLFSTSLLAELLGGGGETPDPDSGTGGSENMDSVIASLGDAVMFYQFGDKKDNDGDGCIDEEIMDEKDNDLDGYIDEDARVISDDKSDGVDNDRDGRKDPVNPSIGVPGNDTLGREARVGETIYPGRGFVLKFVYNYLDTTLQNGVKERNLPALELLNTWVKIKKGAPDELIKIRLAIQRDSLAVRIPLGGPVPDSLKAKLQNAKNQIGGCWRNYP